MLHRLSTSKMPPLALASMICQKILCKGSASSYYKLVEGYAIGSVLGNNSPAFNNYFSYYIRAVVLIETV